MNESAIVVAKAFGNGVARQNLDSFEILTSFDPFKGNLFNFRILVILFKILLYRIFIILFEI